MNKEHKTLKIKGALQRRHRAVMADMRLSYEVIHKETDYSEALKWLRTSLAYLHEAIELTEELKRMHDR